MASKVNINKNKLLTELCLKQRKKIDKKYSLELNDTIRLLKNIDNSIFNKTECVLWKGYLTKCNNNKSCYVNFYLKKRKLALHRILYINFIDDLDIKYYLKFTCNNPGKCCNINHILKVYNEDTTETNINSTNKQLVQDNKLFEEIPLGVVNSSKGTMSLKDVNSSKGTMSIKDVNSSKGTMSLKDVNSSKGTMSIKDVNSSKGTMSIKEVQAKYTSTIQVDITNDINPEVKINVSPSKKNLSDNIKITKIDNNTNRGKIIIIFDD